MLNIQFATPIIRIDQNYTKWLQNVVTNGGTFTANSKTFASALINQLSTQGFYSKIKYLLPLLGGNLAAARTPLIDSLNVGAATNNGMVDADFSETTGLQGNGSTKYLDSLILPSQLGSSNNGGIGYWENNIVISNSWPMGAESSSGTAFEFVLGSPARNFQWGSSSNNAVDSSTTATNGHYYGQRSSAILRSISFNGSQLATNTTSDAASGAGDNTIAILGTTLVPGFAFAWAGRCALAYMTDGTLSAGDISALHSILSTYLIGPTGR